MDHPLRPYKTLCKSNTTFFATFTYHAGERPHAMRYVLLRDLLRPKHGLVDSTRFLSLAGAHLNKNRWRSAKTLSERLVSCTVTGATAKPQRTHSKHIADSHVDAQ